MSTPVIVVLLFTTLAVIYLLWIIIPAVTGLPWIPTKRSRIRKSLELACLSKGQILYDLGAGDGRALILAAREFGVYAVGIEISPIHCLAAMFSAWRGGVSSLVKIKWANYYKVDFSEANVVFIYMTSSEAARLRPILERQLKPGTRVIAISCEINGWEPVAYDREEVIYIYQVGASCSL